MSFKVEFEHDMLPLPDIDGLALAVAASLGQAQIANLRGRLMKGIGEDDKPMKYTGKEGTKTYTDSYAKYRRGKYKKKPPGAPLRIDVRNLMVDASSGMVGSINVQSVESIDENKATATIAPTGAQNINKAYWNQIMTPFIGVSPQDKKTLEELAQIEVDNYLEDLG